MEGFKIHVKFLASTKAVLLEEKVEEAIKELTERGRIVSNVSSNISFAGDKGYMILCQITYYEEVKSHDEDYLFDSDLDFGVDLNFK